MEVAVFSFGKASCLVVVQTFTSSTQVQSTGPVIVTRFFFHMCVFFRAAMGLQFLFMYDNAPCHRTVAAEQLLESEDIELLNVVGYLKYYFMPNLTDVVVALSFPKGMKKSCQILRQFGLLDVRLTLAVALRS
ncbi:hypothetical protein TNCV_3899501 [Trichonephila clavipes]|nr:hypothetical protein TNCV_3899501 [Trichonephila clavipes]